jgi:hypothetical protein
MCRVSSYLLTCLGLMLSVLIWLGGSGSSAHFRSVSAASLADLIAPPASLQGGPIGRAQNFIEHRTWYLFPDNRLLVTEGDSFVPYPFEPGLPIRTIAMSENGLLAATTAGIYLRPADDAPWQLVSDVQAHLLSSTLNEIWVTPDDHPEQVWLSTDGGATWASHSNGLLGLVVSPVRLLSALTFQRRVVTLVDDRYVLWQTANDPISWMQIATLPGDAIAYTPGGVYVGFTYLAGILGPETFIGGSDGNLYQLREENVGQSDDETELWAVVHSFGSGKYPLVLFRDEVALVDLTSGDIQLFIGQPPLDDNGWPTSWEPFVFPDEPPPPPPVPCQELIVNGGFEERRGWVLPVTTFSARYRLQQPIYAGAASLQLGIPEMNRNRFSYSTAYQWITLPVNASKITLRAQVWRGGPGPSERDMHYLWVTTVRDRDYVVFQSRVNPRAWEEVTYDLTPLKGQRVRLLFGVYNNGLRGKSEMYVDEVSIRACP